MVDVQPNQPSEELMRHSSCRTTLDVYTRAVDQQKREASLPVDLQKI
jgi:integrase